MRPFIPLLLLAGVAGCTGTGVTKAQITAIEVSVTEAEVLAKAYLDQPVCPAPAPCSVPATRAKVIHDAHAAHDAFLVLQAAKAPDAGTAMSLTLAAIAVLKSDTPAVPAN